MTSLEDALLRNLKIFVAFARKRLGDEHLAEDVVQDSLIKALAADIQPEGEEATTAWFYRILRRSIIDVYRRQQARSRALERFAQEIPETPTPEEEQALCECLLRLMPLVPEQYRELLQKIDIEGNEIGKVAAELGVTRNNLTVRLHRARKHLRDALAQNCRACSTHGCVDCTCDDSPELSACE
jgi:RNA polymerase sigma factor (sigma-70 family)